LAHLTVLLHLVIDLFIAGNLFVPLHFIIAISDLLKEAAAAAALCVHVLLH
jgi:hypothetical protein